MFSVEGVLQPEDLKRYRFLLINPNAIITSTDVIKLVPKIFDLIREVYYNNGKLLFVEDVTDQSQLYINSVFLREAILYTLASLFKCSVYDMWMLINNQVSLHSHTRHCTSTSRFHPYRNSVQPSSSRSKC